MNNNERPYCATAMAVILIGLIGVFTAWPASTQVLAATFNSSAVGDWTDPANWTPMGVPGPGDIADLENNSTAAPGPAMDLTGDTTIAQLFLGDANPVGNAARLDLNGFVLTATQSIAIGRFGGLGIIDGRTAVGPAKIVTPQLTVASAVNVFDLFANDQANRLTINSGATVSTSDIQNLTISAFVFDQGSLLDLGAALVLSEDLDIRGTGANVATVNANGHDITARDIYIGRFGAAGTILNDGAITATRNLEVSNNTFALDANDSVAGTVAATNGGELTLHANTAAQGADIRSGGRINTVATGNLTTSALVLDQGSLLDLGADLVLSQDLDIRGTGANVATVNANGHDITARDIFIGRFGAAGTILNDGAITATRNLEVSNNIFALDANDSVADTVAATNGGELTLHANTAAQRADIRSGGRINTVATSNLTTSALVLDQGSLLDLGADLVLSQDLDIRGTGANVATVNANGHDITSRDIFIGRFGQAGELVDVRNITANRVFVERSTLNLTGVDHQIDAEVRLTTTDSILNAAASGTVTITGGILSGLGTVQIGAGATLDLSPATVGSSTETLIHNGAGLNLGANDFSVSIDYDNANFGVGNAFDARANVTGSGQILAVDAFSISASGDVGGGSTIDFGNHRVGDVVGDLSYQINHDGSAGSSPQVRTAIQTSAGGGNITDARLSGAGVTASNLAPIAAGGNSGSLGVTFTASSAGALVGQAIHIEDNFDNVNGLTLSVTGAAYNPAVADVQPTNVNFGNFHVGDAVAPQAIMIGNTAPAGAFSEDLLADNFVATPDALIAGGSPSSVQVIAGGSNNALQVGISTAAAGARTGSVTMDLTSTGEVNGVVIPGLGTLGLGQAMVNVSANVYRYAAPVVNDLNLGEFHVGDVAQGNVNVQNTEINDGFSESLRVATDSFAPDVTAASGTVDIAPEGNSGAALSATLSTAAAGMRSGAVTYNLTSLAFAAGLNDTVLPQQQATISASVYRLAEPVIQNLQPVDFGIVHVGEAVAQVGVDLLNDAVGDGFSENLNASFGTVDAGVATNGGSINGLAPQANNATSMLVGIDTSTAAVINGAAQVLLESDGAGINSLGQTPLASQQVQITGQVNNFAVADVVKLSGDGVLVMTAENEFKLDLGTVVLGNANLSAELGILNDVLAPADDLAGDFTLSAPDFLLSGFDAFNDLAAGNTLGGLMVELDSATLGMFSGQIVLSPRSTNPQPFSMNLPNVTINVMGQVAAVPEPASWTLALALAVVGLAIRGRGKR